MAEENGADAPQTAAPQAPVLPKMNVLAQFIRDMSFENVAAQKKMQGNAQPQVQMQVGVEGRKRDADNQYDVIVKTKIESKIQDDGQTVFLIELEYGGVFSIENVDEKQLHPFLHIECPRMLFPFIRRIISDVTRDGGFPPLNLDTIDFVQIYRNQLAMAMQAQKDKPHADA